ncbi:MAG: hypothetical protein MJ201_01135 [Mycoplasmoidaceae bacterium]|nr:hypothetical protein [Mycoplasmoidaceae bacterium]
MKKILCMIPTLVGVLNVVPTTMLVASCSNSNQPKYDEFTKTLYKASYSEFINYIENCPHVSNQDIVTIDSDEDSLKGARVYLKNLVNQYIGVTPTTDAGGNIYYDIPATPGFKNYKKIILQAHMDMV